jgi:three-Cys-motif partner protein
MAEANNFFAEARDQSRVKAAIVAKYFDAWARVIVSTRKRFPSKEQRIAYLDLFAGPGRYADETKSTPLLVLEKAIASPDIRDRLVAIFNDKDVANLKSLQEAIETLPGIATLRHRPQVLNKEVGTDIVKVFDEMKLIPTLFFVDPWGYKGLSLRLINSVLKDWGCDCVFFFNYNRISMGLPNEAVREHMDALFGAERAAELRTRLELMPPVEREREIIESLCEAIKEYGPRFVLPFRFRDENGTRTSHHLIFVSKSFLGYDIMKEIMAKECSTTHQGVASFEYNPIEANRAFRQGLLFELSRPLDDLAEMLASHYAGRSVAVRAIYEEHSVDRAYTMKNYQDVLKKMEESGAIKASAHRKGSMAGHVLITFPPKGPR